MAAVLLGYALPIRLPRRIPAYTLEVSGATSRHEGRPEWQKARWTIELARNPATGRYIDAVAAAYRRYVQAGGDLPFFAWHDTPECPPHEKCNIGVCGKEPFGGRV